MFFKHKHVYRLLEIQFLFLNETCTVAIYLYGKVVQNLVILNLTEIRDY